MNTPTLDTWTVVFLLAAIQGLFLSVVILVQQSKLSSANKYLGALIGLFSLMLIDYFTYWSNYRFAFPYLFGFSFGFPLWYGPILYFYIRELNNIQKPSRFNQLLHFLPGVIFYLYMIPYFTTSYEAKIDLFLDANNQSLLSILATPTLKIVHMAIYLVAAFKVGHSDRENEKLQAFHKWQQIILTLFLLFIVSNATYYLLIVTIDFEIEYDYMISMTMATAIYTIGYLGYKHPEIIHGFESVRGKYEKSSLKDTEASDLSERLTELLEYDKIYRQSDLKLKDVAKKLDIPIHHLSQVVNEKLRISFPELINTYRVNEVKRNLVNPDHSDQKILAIALDAGFNNKANFNNAFRKQTGMSPSDYRKLHQLAYMN